MRILFLTAPMPPNRFHRIRAFNLVKYLSRSHRITLVTLATGSILPDDELRRYCQEIHYCPQAPALAALNCLRAIPTATPFEVAYCKNQAMQRTVAELLASGSIDLVYIKRLRCAQFVPPRTKVPCVVDATDAMSWYYQQAKTAVPWYQRWLFAHEWMAYQRYERQMLQRYRHWVVCSDLDRQYLQQLAPSTTRFWVIPNGVDLEYFAATTQKPEPNAILLSGLMDKFVNIEAAEWFVRNILANVATAVPAVKLYVVGPKPTAAVRRLRSSQVTVVGMVPDLRPWIARAMVVVCPVRTGVGTRNKILQAWAMGRPVVTTTKGLEGLAAGHGRHVLIADDADAFARQTVQLLLDDGLRQRLVSNGLALVRATYAMEVIAEAVAELIATVRAKAAAVGG